MKQLMLITNANVKSETREIKAKKERENLNKSMFLSLCLEKEKRGELM